MSRTVYCPTCGKVAKLVEDERTGKIGWTCPDTSCPDGRHLFDSVTASDH